MKFIYSNGIIENNLPHLIEKNNIETNLSLITELNGFTITENDIDFPSFFQDTKEDNIYIFPFQNNLYLIIQRKWTAIIEKGTLKWNEMDSYGNFIPHADLMITQLKSQSELYIQLQHYFKTFALFQIPFYFIPIVRETYNDKYGELKGNWSIIIHKNVELRNNKLKFHVENKITLRSYQLNAITEWRNNHYFGTICLATAGGKTIIALEGIAELGFTAMIAVPTEPLLFQWKKDLQDFLNLKESQIGLFYGKKKELKPILLGTYTSLMKYICFTEPERKEILDSDISELEKARKIQYREKLRDYLQNYYSMLVLDECLIGDTLITMNNGSVKQIKEIKNGDIVKGGLVSNKFEKNIDKILKIRTNFGILSSSELHPNLVIKELKKSTRHIDYDIKLNPNESDIEQILSKDLEIGNYLLIPSKISNNELENFTQDELYFIGIILCDGHLDSQGYRTKLELHHLSKIEIFEPLFEKILNKIDPFAKLKISEIKRNNMKNQQNYYTKTIWTTSKLIRDYLSKFNVPLGKKSNIIDIDNKIFNCSLKSIKSFIQACFDCEGWALLSNKRIGFSSTSIIFIQKLQQLLLRFEIFSKIRIKLKDNLEHHICYHLDITGEDLIKFHANINFRIRDKKEKLEQIMRKPPNRTFNHYVKYQDLNYILSQIISIEEVKEDIKVYDFTTESHTFIANGFLTHNCHHIPAPTFRQLSLNSKALIRMSLSATVKRFDHNETLLYFSAGKKIFELSYLDLCDQGYVIPFYYSYLPIYLNDEQMELYMQYGQNLEAKKALSFFNTQKLLKVLKIVSFHIKQGHKILIFVSYVKSAHQIFSELQDRNIACGLILSEKNLRKITSMKRNNTIDLFKQNKLNVLISTTVLDEGFNVPEANVGIICSGVSNDRQMIQRIGRIVRTSKNSDKLGYIYEITSEFADASIITLDQYNRLVRNGMIKDTLTYNKDKEILSNDCWTFDYDKINDYVLKKSQDRHIPILNYKD